MSKESKSGGFSGYGTVGVIALLIAGGIFARNQFSSPSISVNGNNNETAARDINKNTNTTVYGSTDSLLVVPNSSPTVTSAGNPKMSTAPASEYALQIIEPPIIANPVQKTLPKGTIVNGTLLPEAAVFTSPLGLIPGEEYRLDFVVNYRSQTLTKFYANLNPDVDDPTMRNKAHLDNISVIGKALQGDGTMKFSLRGKAPMERGKYRREITLGLMDHEKWMMQPPFVHYSHPFVIVVR